MPSESRTIEMYSAVCEDCYEAERRLPYDERGAIWCPPAPTGGKRPCDLCGAQYKVAGWSFLVHEDVMERRGSEFFQECLAAARERRERLRQEWRAQRELDQDVEASASEALRSSAQAGGATRAFRTSSGEIGYVSVSGGKP